MAFPAACDQGRSSADRVRVEEPGQDDDTVEETSRQVVSTDTSMIV